MTPEGEVKKLVRALLEEYKICPSKLAGAVPPGSQGWYDMPVKSPFGVKGIPDFYGHYRGTFFSVETKAPKKEPTGFQALQIKAIRSTGGACFVVDGPETLKVFEEWLCRI